MKTFKYTAILPRGAPVGGTVDAIDAEGAARKVKSWHANIRLRRLCIKEI